MNIHGKIEISGSNGPGNRSVIWLQGCSLNCRGCWNPLTHSHGQPNTSIFDLATWVIDNPVIEGITISGGEPFQQAPALELLLAIIKDARPKLTVGIYTGYTLKELQENKFSWYSSAYDRLIPGDEKLLKSILKQVDFLVAGRYNEDLACVNKPLCGSLNQQIELVSKRYKSSDFELNSTEILVDEIEGLVQLTGFPDGKNLLANDKYNEDDGLIAA